MWIGRGKERVSDWALLISSIGALVTALVGIGIAVSTRRKNQGDVTLTITQAAENIVAMREKDIAELKAEIRDREADVALLKQKVLDRDQGIEALNVQIEAHKKDLRELRMRLQDLYRYVEYLHQFISGNRKKKVQSLDDFLRRTAEAKTHFERE